MCGYVRGAAAGAVLAASLLVSAGADAQIFGRGARTEFISGFGIRTFASFMEAGDRIAGDPAGDPASGTVARDSSARTTPFSVVYGLGRRVSVIGIVPIVDRTFTRTTAAGAERLAGGTGIGDVTFLAKWRAYKRDRGRGSLRLALQGGIKVPTGSNDLRDAAGDLLPPDLQRGTGSWDPTADVILSYVNPAGRWFLSAATGGTIATTADGFRAGHQLAYDAMLKRRVSPLGSRDVFLLLELNGRWRGHARADGVEIEGSGGNLVYLSPGVQVLVRPNIVAEAGVQLPVLRDLNGTQLGPDVNALVGIRYIIVP